MKYTNEESDVAMSYIEASSVFVGLPLTVNVQDFFRKERYLLFAAMLDYKPSLWMKLMSI